MFIFASKTDFQVSILKKSTVLRHICHFWSSGWQDTDLKTIFWRHIPNKVIFTSLSHLDMFCPRCQNGGKWWLFIGWRQSLKQNGKVRILLNIFLAIHFRFYVFPTPTMEDKNPWNGYRKPSFHILNLSNIQM